MWWYSSRFCHQLTFLPLSAVPWANPLPGCWLPPEVVIHYSNPGGMMSIMLHFSLQLWNGSEPHGHLDLIVLQELLVLCTSLNPLEQVRTSINNQKGNAQCQIHYFRPSSLLLLIPDSGAHHVLSQNRNWGWDPILESLLSLGSHIRMITKCCALHFLNLEPVSPSPLLILL